MASDDELDEGREGDAWSPQRIEAEIRALQRKQYHQREQQLLLQEGINRIAEALRDQPGLDYPEELKPVTYMDGGRKDVLFLSFGGVKQGYGMPTAEFHSSFSTRDAPGYFIKDFRQSWYQEGLLGLSHDVDSTVEYLRGLIDRHGARHVVTLGVSAGGYAAILFGALLGVDRVAAFSPQIDVNARVTRMFASFDTPMPKALAGLATAPPLPRVLRLAEKRPEVSIYYCEAHRFDGRTAELMAKVNGVRLCPSPGDEHPVTRVLKRNGQLDRILDELISF